jgi:shikimate dehydrogenase
MTTTPKLAGVMGWPIGHSRSPILHGTWLKRYDIAGYYVPLPVQPDRLEAALRGLQNLGFAGVNLTIPHKERAAQLVDRLTVDAARSGSVNMVTVLPDGTLEGASTDGYGFVENLRQALGDWPAHVDRPVLVIGAGGAAKAIIPALSDCGYRSIRVANRTDARAHVLADTFGIEPVAWERRDIALDDVGLVINTTSQGMVGQPPLDLDLMRLPVDAIVTDIVYTPLLTPLLIAARDRGNVIVDGLGMLLHQARPAFARWFGVDPVVDQALRDAVLRA